MSTQLLNETTLASTGPLAGTAPRTMTVSGVAVKTVGFLVLTLIGGSVGWSRTSSVIQSTSGPSWLLWFFLLIGLSVLTVSRPQIAPLTGAAFAFFQGVWMGAISHVYEVAYEGIVAQALLASVCAFLGMLILYTTGAIKPTAKLMAIIFGATFGIALLYLVAFFFSLFGVDLYFWNNPTPVGIGVSVLIVAIACLNLIADFAMIDYGVQQELPATAEWFCAFGLMSTLLWMYIEILRLLAVLRR
ncbi:Bax inhibitor-1/YccA family protein [Aquihabitans sp. McL0605]|uniref:Bax inhibitor-1/YccA family protein n=1 Tax=Aquihabitans sp. McL0605 TaxID=3415671 RepID=UPI003CEE2583